MRFYRHVTPPVGTHAHRKQKKNTMAGEKFGFPNVGFYVPWYFSRCHDLIFDPKFARRQILKIELSVCTTGKWRNKDGVVLFSVSKFTDVLN